MNPREFDRLSGLYLDGEAGRDQVLALREALRAQPELRARLAAHVRLHRVQGAALGRRAGRSAALLDPLRTFGARAGVALAHACLVLAVIVGSDVALPRIEAQSWIPASARGDASPEIPVLDEAAPSPLPAEDPESAESAPLPEVREADFLES